MFASGNKKTLVSTSLILLLFILASVSIFIFQNHESGFAIDHRGQTSSMGATLSKSLLIENKHLVMLIGKQLLDNGEVYYHYYNRFPVFEYLITGAVMQIFEPDLAMQIYIARQVMNLFLLASLLICFFIVKEIISDNFPALFVSLLVFSSYYILYYNDMISNMSTPLSGFVLALLIVVKSYKHNLRTSLIVLLSMLSIFTGWQSYAVFVAWFSVDTFTWFFKKKKTGSFVKTVFSQPSFIALVSSIMFGSLVLGGQILNEWSLKGGSFMEIPTIQGVIRRFGLAKTTDIMEYPDLFGKDLSKWHYFLAVQVFRIFIMIVPFAGIIISKVTKPDLVSLAPGMLFALISGVMFINGIVRFRNKIDFKLVSIFALSGLVWAVPLRYYTAWHDHQSVFYIGFSIMYFVILSFYFHKTYVLKTLAVAVCFLFILSVYQMNFIKSANAERLNAITMDFKNIYAELPPNSKVYVDCAGRFGRDKFGWDVCRNEVSADLGLGGQSLDFYLVGHYRVLLKNAEYIISRNPDYNEKRLTNNPTINLFRNIIKP